MQSRTALALPVHHFVTAFSPTVQYGKTALMIASRAGNTDAVRVLVDAGADLNITDEVLPSTSPVDAPLTRIITILPVPTRSVRVSPAPVLAFPYFTRLVLPSLCRRAGRH